MNEIVLLVSPECDAPSLGMQTVELSTDFTLSEVDPLPSVLALWGDDHFVASVARLVSRLDSPPVLAPLAIDGDTHLANQVHGPKTEAVVGALLSGNYEVVARNSMRVTDTATAGSMLAFSFGAGQIEAAFEAREAAENDGLDSIVRGLGRESALRGAARVSVDWQPLSESCGWIHASTLERSWFRTRVSPDGRSRFRCGETAVEWLSHATRLGKWVSGKGDAATFDAIHIDADTGYVVDGRRFEPCSRVIEVAPGPQIRIAQVT